MRQAYDYWQDQPDIYGGGEPVSGPPDRRPTRPSRPGRRVSLSPGPGPGEPLPSAGSPSPLARPLSSALCPLQGPVRARCLAREPSTRRPSAATAAGFRTDQVHVTSLLSADSTSRRFLALTLTASVAGPCRSPAIARRLSRPRARLCACRGTVCIQPRLRRGLPLRSWCFSTESAWSRHLLLTPRYYSSSPTYIANAGIGGY